MTKARKILLIFAIGLISASLLWMNSVRVTGFAVPGTCKIEMKGQTQQLSISDTMALVDARINANQSLPAESITCTQWPSSYESSQDMNMIGLTNAAQYMWDQVDARFGFIPFGGFAPGGVSTGHSENSKHYQGKAIDFFFKPYKKASKVAKGWTFANWAVANAQRLGITNVIYQDRIWSSNSSFKGWQNFVPTYGDLKNATIRHLDHVHIDVN